MSFECTAIHEATNKMTRYHFPFSEKQIPMNGIYVLFEINEYGHEADRIVRVGTHTGKNQLRSRLKQHFLAENKDRSIFRKNIGRSILNKRNDPFLDSWNIDLTTRAAKEKYSESIDFEYKKMVETEVSQYIRANFTFVVIEVNEKNERLKLESRLISTISRCSQCVPSQGWLGQYSPKTKIAKSGLWLENELYKTPFDRIELSSFLKLICN